MFTVVQIAQGVDGSTEHEPGESRDAFLMRNIVNQRDSAVGLLKAEQKARRAAEAECEKLRAEVSKKDEALTLALRYVTLARKAGFAGQMEIAGTGGFGMLAAAMRG